jgi:hypothetical protein
VIALPGEPPTIPPDAIDPEHANLMTAEQDLGEADDDLVAAEPDVDVIADDQVADELEVEDLPPPQEVHPTGERPQP